jgi:hypothetical protein
MGFTAICTSKVGNGMFTENLREIFPTQQLALIAALKRFGTHAREHSQIIPLDKEQA